MQALISKDCPVKVSAAELKTLVGCVHWIQNIDCGYGEAITLKLQKVASFIVNNDPKFAVRWHRLCVNLNTKVSDPLPAGWQARYSWSRRRYYFFDEKNHKVTTFTRPARSSSKSAPS